MSRSSQRAARLARLLLLLPCVLGLGGCSLYTPPCEQSCRKVLRCGEDDGLTLQECTLSCQRQEALYEDWEDEAKLEAYHDHRRCISFSSCEEIAEGACYDETLFPF